MSDRATTVLTGVLERRVHEGMLSQPQADAVLIDFRTDYGRYPVTPPASTVVTGEAGAGGEAGGGPGRAPWSAILAEVGGYIGAAFVVGAVLAIVGPEWDGLGRTGRVVALAVPGVLLLLAAIGASLAPPAHQSPADPLETGGPDHDQAARSGVVEPDRTGPSGLLRRFATVEGGPRHRLVSAFTLAGGGLVAGAVAAAVEGHDLVGWVPLVTLAIWGAAYLAHRGVLLQLGVVASLSWLIGSAPPVDGHDLVMALLLALLAAVWAGLAVVRVVREPAVAFAAAGVIAFIGGQMSVWSEHSTIGYLILAAAAVAGLLGYARTRQISALGVGAVTLAVLVPQAVIDYTAGALGAAGALLVSGLSVVAVSVLVARLHGRRPADPTSTIESKLGPTELV